MFSIKTAFTVNFDKQRYFKGLWGSPAVHDYPPFLLLIDGAVFSFLVFERPLEAVCFSLFGIKSPLTLFLISG